MTASLLADWIVDIDPELLQAYRLLKNGYRIFEKQEIDDLQIPHQSAVANAHLHIGFCRTVINNRNL
jgi:hypothetical protein